MDESRPLSAWARKYFADGSKWFGGPGWDEIVATSPYRDEAGAAARALREVLPWSWLMRCDLDATFHPVVRQHILRGDVAVLLEAGVMFARYPGTRGRLAKRLRNAREYADALAELRVGLFLSDAGARLSHEPKGSRDTGPDWRATWDDVEAWVEVKHPHWSEQALTISNLQMAFLFELQRSLVGVVPTAPAWLTIELDRTLVRESMLRTWFNRERIEDAARRAASELKTRLPVPTRSERIVVDGVATFDVELGPTPPVQFYTRLTGTPPDDEPEIAKIARVLEEAACQLASLEGARIVALHLGIDSAVANYSHEIEVMLAREHWARSIDAVLLVDAIDRNLETCNYVIEAPSPCEALSRFMAHLLT